MQALLDAIAAMSLPVDACRIFHGRGGLYSGCEQWTLDAYPPVFVLTSFAPMTDEQLATIGAALQARWSHLARIFHACSQRRAQRGIAARI